MSAIFNIRYPSKFPKMGRTPDFGIFLKSIDLGTRLTKLSSVLDHLIGKGGREQNNLYVSRE